MKTFEERLAELQSHSPQCTAEDLRQMERYAKREEILRRRGHLDGLAKELLRNAYDRVSADNLFAPRPTQGDQNHACIEVLMEAVVELQIDVRNLTERLKKEQTND